MKNLYEILEVSEKASDEIIEKAYKTLAKKYHPDLQKDAQSKEKASKKMVEVNSAYETLRNKEKRMQYDEKLKVDRARKKEIEDRKREQEILDNYSNVEYKENGIKKEYENPYINYYNTQNYYKRRGFSFKKLIRVIVFFIIIYLIFKILLVIPFTKNYLLKIYNENVPIKIIVDILIGVCNGIKSAFINAWNFRSF